MTLISLACPSDPLSKSMAPKPPSTSPSLISRPSLPFWVSRFCQAVQLVRTLPISTNNVMEMPSGLDPGKENSWQEEWQWQKSEECAQLFSDAVPASSVGQGVAGKPSTTAGNVSVFSFSLQINLFFQLPLLRPSFLNHTFQGGDLWSPYLKTDTCPSIPHQGPGHILPVFLPQCDPSLVSVHFCQTENTMLCVLFLRRPPRTEQASICIVQELIIYLTAMAPQLQCYCLENPMDGGAWWVAVHGVATSRTRLSHFTFNFHFHALEIEMATHSSVLAWKIPGPGDPGGLPSMGSHRVGHDWSDLAAAAACPAVRCFSRSSMQQF